MITPRPHKIKFCNQNLYILIIYLMSFTPQKNVNSKTLIFYYTEHIVPCGCICTSYNVLGSLNVLIQIIAVQILLARLLKIEVY